LYLTNLLNKEGEKINKGQLMTKNTSDLSNKTILPYLNSLTQFDKKLARYQHVFYQFNKANDKSFKFLFDKTSKLLNLTFLSIGCLMSRPVYKVTYTKNNLEFEHNTAFQDLSNNFTRKFMIDLSFFIRKNKNKYLHNNVEVNDNIIFISHPAELITNNNNNSTIEELIHLPSDSSTSMTSPNVNLPQKEIQIKKGIQSSFNMNNNIKVGSAPQLPQTSQRNNILCKYNDKFQNLTDYLNTMFKSEIELDLVRLHKVFYDSQILVQDIALKSYKFRFVKLVNRLFKRLHIQKLDFSNSLNKSEGLSFPSYLSGINIKLAGRTFRQRVVPRMTVKRIQKGSLTNVNVQFIDRARFTGKTRRGAYSFTITLGHVFK
jgi:hypothetical protein